MTSLPSGSPERIEAQETSVSKKRDQDLESASTDKDTPTIRPHKPLENEEIEINVEQKRKCNCKNSRCLKLYCDCFSSRVYCTNCNCIGCNNVPEKAHLVEAAVRATLERNPKAFAKKIQYFEDSNSVSGQHSKGCFCKKSGCLKKYCECFQAGIQCTDRCKCRGCRNKGGTHTNPESPPLKRQRVPRVASAPPQYDMYFKPISISPASFLPTQLSQLITAAKEEEECDSGPPLVQYLRSQEQQSIIPVHREASLGSQAPVIHSRKMESLPKVTSALYNEPQQSSLHVPTQKIIPEVQHEIPIHSVGRHTPPEQAQNYRSLSTLLKKTIVPSGDHIRLAPPQISPTPWTTGEIAYLRAKSAPPGPPIGRPVNDNLEVPVSLRAYPQADASIGNTPQEMPKPTFSTGAFRRVGQE